MFYENNIFQGMYKTFCVEFQMYPVKFHMKYVSNTLKDVYFIQMWNFTISLI